MPKTRAIVASEVAEVDEFLEFLEFKKRRELLKPKVVVKPKPEKKLEVVEEEDEEDEKHPRIADVRRTTAICGHKCVESRCYTHHDGRMCWWTKSKWARPTWCKKQNE